MAERTDGLLERVDRAYDAWAAYWQKRIATRQELGYVSTPVRESL